MEASKQTHSWTTALQLFHYTTQYFLLPTSRTYDGLNKTQPRKEFAQTVKNQIAHINSRNHYQWLHDKLILGKKKNQNIHIWVCPQLSSVMKSISAIFLLLYYIKLYLGMFHSYSIDLYNSFLTNKSFENAEGMLPLKMLKPNITKIKMMSKTTEM